MAVDPQLVETGAVRRPAAGASVSASNRTRDFSGLFS